nr:MAG TPA: hypothetical protein [Caudoviricetes sp.]DAU79517.1 MAG TPA: hypothetical protein [Caudoviricetes sp.]
MAKKILCGGGLMERHRLLQRLILSKMVDQYWAVGGD